MLNLKETFGKFDDDFLKFEHIENPRHRSPDLCAFLLLAELAPEIIKTKGPYFGRHEDIVGCAEHDQIWLSVDLEQLAEKATEDNILELVRCGVRYDDDIDSLSMYV